MYENVQYKNPFLTEVIYRVDFPSPLTGLEDKLPTSLSKRALEKFPIFEPQKTHAQEFQFKGSDFQAKSSEVVQWKFFGKEREKSLTIGPNHYFLQSTRYSTFENFAGDLEGFQEAFHREFRDATASRVGLRYINVLDIPGDDPLSWAEYVNEFMLGIIDFHEHQESITRAFNILEFNFDGQAVKFQFGIANPDYPAVVRRKQFVLDLDSYFQGSFEGDEVKDCLEIAHEKIQHLFELSITDKTRELMKPKSNEPEE